MASLTERWRAVWPAREELELLSLLDGSIRARGHRVRQLRETVDGLKSLTLGDRVQGGADHTPTIVLILDLERECLEEIRQRHAVMIEIERRIKAITDPLLGEILIERYIDQLPWCKIASNVCFSESHLKHELHISAVEAYAQAHPTRIALFALSSVK